MCDVLILPDGGLTTAAEKLNIRAENRSHPQRRLSASPRKRNAYTRSLIACHPHSTKVSYQYLRRTRIVRRDERSSPYRSR